MPSTPEINNRVLRHLSEMRRRATDSRDTSTLHIVFACLIGVGLAGVFLLIAWPRG